ncbi:hypothetical protein [Oleiagrimonas sp. C23AA]|uniref:hypothetical protein n=1 Tax=Oleiagrimonas sp. C23AA TaxID=2719047 RepID=UPI00141EF1F0|nr:hypothetical protein [Oleiagrimonas sp. C23AA]NII10129.1 hypothetical protein [Oleiagrimonas sp. C23AA]
MKSRFVTQLLLPLLAATALAILVHLWWAADGFFLNLAAGFVGSLVTVGYIDWILRRHEEDRWSDADSRISSRLKILANSTVTGIRVAFGYKTDIFDRRAMASGDSEVMHAEVMRVAIHVLSPGAEAHVTSLNQAQWKSFVSHLHQSSIECGIMLDRFGHRLQPNTIATLLDLQHHLESAQTFWQVFPDIAGVPADQLPQTKTPPEELQAAWCEITARAVRNVLEAATQLAAIA